MPIGDLLPEIALAVAAVVVLLTASSVRRERAWLGAPLTLLGVAVAAALVLRQAGSGAPAALTFHGTWALDGAATAAKLTILVVTALTAILAPHWLASDRRHGEYYAVLLLSALGAILLAGAADTLELVVAALLSSVTGYTLAAYHRAWPLAVEAGMKYFLIGALTNALLVLGVAILFGLVGDTGYHQTAEALAAPGSSGGVAGWPASLPLLAAVALVTVGLAYKLAAFPAHAWMPDVAEGSPVPSAAFLTVAPKVGAAIALARFVDLLPPGAIPWRTLIAALAVVTMTLGNLAALWQSDLRRLIGWSSVSQSGYALVAVAVIGRSELALPALIVFLAGYAAANLTAFAVVAELRGRTEIEHYRGLSSERPMAAALLALAFLSLVGIPPLAGFVGKLGLFTVALEAGAGWLAVAVVANTVISLFYYLRALGPMYFDEPREDAPAVGRLGRWSFAAMVVAGALTAALGLGAEALFGALRGVRLLP